MKKILFLFCFVSVTGTMAQTYSSPESVEKNTPDGSYFIANRGAQEILRLLPDGTLLPFASGLTSGPNGLELLGDTLYACDGGSVKLIDRVTGTIIQNVNLGGIFLNGITHKGHDLFITDFTAKKIYRMNTKTNAFNVFVNALANTPNGIIYDELNDRLVYVCWGSSAPIRAVNLADSTTSLLTTTSVGNIDGIAMNCQGDFYISCWSPNSIRKYNSAFTTTSVLATTGISGPADIYFDASKDSLYVPNSGSANNVVKVYAPSCLVTGTSELPAPNTRLNVYPNPSEGFYTLNGLTGPAEIIVTDLSGKRVMQNSVSVQTVTIDLSFSAPGVYLLTVKDAAGARTIKIDRQ